MPSSPRTLPAWPRPMAPGDAHPPRRAVLRVAVALGGIAAAVLGVAALARLPWTAGGAALGALTLLGAGLGWAWRRHRAPTRAQRWHTTASGVEPIPLALVERDEDTLLPALLPLADRRRRALGLTQGRLTVHVGPGVAQVRLPPSTVTGLAQVLDAALDDATRHARPGSRLRFELDLRHGETGSHLRLAVVSARPAVAGRHRATTHAHAPAATPTRARPNRASTAAMQRVTTALGAQLDIAQDARGTCVEWVLPLTSAERRAA